MNAFGLPSVVEKKSMLHCNYDGEEDNLNYFSDKWYYEYSIYYVHIYFSIVDIYCASSV